MNEKTHELIDRYRDVERMTGLSGDRPQNIGWVPLERVLQQEPDGETSGM